MEITDYQEAPEDRLPTLNLGTTKDPYFQSERRKWLDGDDTGHVFNGIFIYFIYRLYIIFHIRINPTTAL